MTIEGMKGVEFAGLNQRKKKNLLRVVKEIYEIRRYKLMTASFPINEAVIAASVWL